MQQKFNNETTISAFGAKNSAAPGLKNYPGNMAQQ
jgi:hypothetical protein